MFILLSLALMFHFILPMIDNSLFWLSNIHFPEFGVQIFIYSIAERSSECSFTNNRLTIYLFFPSSVALANLAKDKKKQDLVPVNKTAFKILHPKSNIDRLNQQYVSKDMTQAGQTIIFCWHRIGTLRSVTHLSISLSKQITLIWKQCFNLLEKANLFLLICWQIQK